MKVRLSSAARTYIHSEAAYLRRHSRAAAAFLYRMTRAREILTRFPNIGLQADDLPILGSHRLIIGEYLLDYERHLDGVLITAIRHGSQARGVVDLDVDFDYEA